jgi:hypothetical protein
MLDYCLTNVWLRPMLDNFFDRVGSNPMFQGLTSAGHSHIKVIQKSWNSQKTKSCNIVDRFAPDSCKTLHDRWLTISFFNECHTSRWNKESKTMFYSRLIPRYARELQTYRNGARSVFLHYLHVLQQPQLSSILFDSLYVPCIYKQLYVLLSPTFLCMMAASIIV